MMTARPPDDVNRRTFEGRHRKTIVVVEVFAPGRYQRVQRRIGDRIRFVDQQNVGALAERHMHQIAAIDLASAKAHIGASARDHVHQQGFSGTGVAAHDNDRGFKADLPDDFAERRLQRTAYARAAGAGSERIRLQLKMISRVHGCSVPPYPV